MAVNSRIEPEPVSPVAEPAGGEAQQALGGGLAIQLARVFAENRLAIVGVALASGCRQSYPVGSTGECSYLPDDTSVMYINDSYMVAMSNVG